jgi:hypothetical protein
VADVQSVRIRVTRFQPFSSRTGVDTVVGLAFRYDADLVAKLKTILREARSHCRVSGHPGGWLDEHRKWFVEPAAWPFVRRRLEAAGCVLVEDPSAEENNNRTTADKSAGPVSALEPVLRQWYHRLAMRYHPDRGGSNEAMQVINYAADELRRMIAAAEGDR